MGLSGWRDAAIVLLVLEAFIGFLIAGAVLYYCTRGVQWLKERIPMVTRPATAWLWQAEHATRQASDAAISPFVRAGAGAAQVKAAWRQAAKGEGRTRHV